MNRHRQVYTLLSLMLFLIFVIGSFFVITFEIRGYQNIDQACSLQDQLTTPLAYFNTRLKSGDEHQRIHLVKYENTDCLRIDTDKTMTLIYYHDGYIKEIYANHGYEPTLDQGNELFAVDHLEMSEENQLYVFTIVVNNESRSLSLYLHG